MDKASDFGSEDCSSGGNRSTFHSNELLPTHPLRLLLVAIPQGHTKVPLRIELRLSESKSDVITITPWNRCRNFIQKSDFSTPYDHTEVARSTGAFLHVAHWSSGMIPALGVGGPGFKSRMSPKPQGTSACRNYQGSVAERSKALV
ncbi:hypothetical protein OUZ56_018773 [Daphnia magna]|uniref:Uncharacterized protein n=1 Tax=Daphnia magna TaxID=35525 RepID=A0ABQ9Z9Q5_9CRUS|nr:hypothetical protein OUZ56_018773 [Daphnia magna]